MYGCDTRFAHSHTDCCVAGRRHGLKQAHEHHLSRPNHDHSMPDEQTSSRRPSKLHKRPASRSSSAEDWQDGGASSGDIDDVPPRPAPLRRTSSSSSSYGATKERRNSIPRAPPTLDDDPSFDQDGLSGGEDDDFDQPENVLGGWHFAPLLIAVVPPIGAVLGGHSDAWSDAILLVLASFWLYQFLKGR